MALAGDLCAGEGQRLMDREVGTQDRADMGPWLSVVWVASGMSFAWNGWSCHSLLRGYRKPCGGARNLMEFVLFLRYEAVSR